MNHKGLSLPGCRRSPLPHASTRTLHHPSFQPLYAAADVAPHRQDRHAPTVHPIIPEDFFYRDPTMSSGRRIPNEVSDLMVMDYFRLNTPPPLMSACVAPPAGWDPFRSEPHPTRDLGSLTLRANALHPPVQTNRFILQLTPEEDRAVTHLLALRHHREPAPGVESLGAEHANPTPLIDRPEPTDSASPGGSRGQLEQGRFWSHVELEAANTLFSRFSPTEDDQNRSESAAAFPGPQPNRHRGSETLPASPTTDGTRDEEDHIGRTPGELLEDLCADYLSVCEEYLAFPPSSRSKGNRAPRGSLDPEARERPLSDPEEDAVFVLLNLGDAGVSDATQGESQT